MQDLIVVVTVAVFFGLCLAFVAGCTRILGPADVDAEDHLDPELVDAGRGA